MPNRTLHLLHKTNPNHYLFDYHTCISKIQKGTILLQGQQIFQIEIEGHFFSTSGTGQSGPPSNRTKLVHSI